MDLKNVYPRKHVDFLVEQDGEVSHETFEFESQEGKRDWDIVQSRQQELLAGGATGANTCHYRTLLDRDGYRD